MPFHIAAASRGEPRVVSESPLHAGDFAAIARSLGQAPFRARKTGTVVARQSRRRQCVKTRWNGIETVNWAAPGDWIVTTLAQDRTLLRDGDGALNTYVIAAKRFAALYEAVGIRTRHGSVYQARGAEVIAIELAGGFDIVAPWGERQQAAAGYLICSGDEVYGNAAETFGTTYTTSCPP